jgi:hypothetical protein
MTPTALVCAALGAALAGAILWDAFETILVPRRIGRRVRITRYFYMLTWPGWRALALRATRPARREGLLGFFGPLSLIVLLVCWAFGLIVAFALLQVAAENTAVLTRHGAFTLLYLSGETFFTLGFGDITPAHGVGRALAVLEAGMGFGFLGTVVGYLPTIYSAFSQRELQISMLDARAGSPPTAAEFLRRLPAPGTAEAADALLRDWEQWSAQLLETHISYPLLAYYRSQHGNQSWLGALTVILDSTALALAGIDAAPSRQARLTFAMSRHAIVDLAQIFGVRYSPGAPDRLPPPTMQVLRSRLEGTPLQLPAQGEFEQRLSALRLMYEPYAQALAEYLVLELPPWVHAAPRRDNWRGGPWDRQLAVRAATEHSIDDHF